jgi:putative exosortase-associated protein (TIGR04073 family)
MKKFIIIILISVFVLSSAGTGYCGAMRKLKRGVANLVTWPMELPYRMSERNKRSGPYEAATYGLIEGACTMCVRLAAGAWETATFFFPLPDRYEPILSDPEFFFSNEKKN